MSEIVMESVNGDEIAQVKTLTAEDYECLRALQASPHWKVYRRILLQVKEAYFNSCLPMKDPNEVMKRIGLVGGLNIALNQLPALVMQYEHSIKKAQEIAEAKAKKKGH